MDRDEKLEILKDHIRTGLELGCDDVEMINTDSGFTFKFESTLGSKRLTITKYLLDDRPFNDIKCYVVGNLAQLNSIEQLDLTKQSFDEYYKS